MVHVVLQTQNRDPLLVYLIPPMQISICICEALRAVPTHSLHGQFLEDREPNKFPFRPNLRNTQFPQQFLCIDKFNNFLHALQRETEIGLLGNWQASVQPSCYHIIELKKKEFRLDPCRYEKFTAKEFHICSYEKTLGNKHFILHRDRM